jgi:L-erythro-3,5-diaminohexanoate dehydrogenase
MLEEYYGYHRVLQPPGAGLQGALKLNTAAIPGLTTPELHLAVILLELDSTSMRQIHAQAGEALKNKSPGGERPALLAEMTQIIAGIVAERGKMHNPVTGSGGVMVARLASAPPSDHPQFAELDLAFRESRRIIPLCSLTSIPLQLAEIGAPDLEKCQVPVRGTARLAPAVRVAVLPADEDILPTAVALQCIDISRLLPQLSLLLTQLPPAPTIAILGMSPFLSFFFFFLFFSFFFFFFLF